MALNPIVFTEKVVRSFLRYQLTAYPFADERLLAQMRRLLSLDETRQSPLLQGPYVSVSRPFRRGAAVDEHTLFAIASNTKAVTCAALAILIDEGKVKWDEPVRTYLPEFTGEGRDMADVGKAASSVLPLTSKR